MNIKGDLICVLVTFFCSSYNLLSYIAKLEMFMYL